MNYEELLAEAYDSGVDVIDYSFASDRIKGLYCNGTVALKEDLTTIEKACTLAEELGHHYTTYGNIIDQESVSNRKQELRARAWAYQKLLRISDIVRAMQSGCRNRYEIADYLDITEEFLTDALSYYREKYGPYVEYGACIIYFEPLGLFRKL